MNSHIGDDGTEPIYRTDSAQLYRGNVLTILPRLEQGSTHLVIADPPYCSGSSGSAQRTSQSPRDKYVQTGAAHVLPDFDSDQRDQRSFTYWCTLWLAHCHRLTARGGVVMVFTDWRQLPRSRTRSKAPDGFGGVSSPGTYP